MIEKLKTINPYDETEIDMDTNSVGGMVYENTPLIQKINELVDAVNGILDYAPLEMAMKAEPAENGESSKMEQDPYAEQRKWIGKVCKFWNWDNTGLAHYSKLITIKDINDGEMANCPFRADDGGWYMYCEPVKLDDDIIYKGATMSKDIWHKPSETTDVDNNLIIDDWTNGTYELGYFDDNDMIFRNFRNDDVYDEESMMRWCDVDELIHDYDRTRKALEQITAEQKDVK